MSVTFTVRIPKRLAEKMKKYREINWSEVVRKSIEEYIMRLEESRSALDADEVLEELLNMGVSPEDLEPLDYSIEKKYYEMIGEAEWKRLSSIRAK